MVLRNARRASVEVHVFATGKAANLLTVGLLQN